MNLRGYYGEGSKTMAYEIAEQLGWRLPSAIVAPMAGGSLVTKLGKGFKEFIDAGLVTARRRVYGTRPRDARADRAALGARRLDAGAGDPEHDRAVDRDRESGRRPVRGEGDGESGGRGQHVSDEALVAGIHLLAETTGVFTETAGGVTVAGRSRWPRPGTSVPTTRLYCASRGTD